MSDAAYRILYFDIENRPLTYMGNDYTSGDVTVIAAGWDHVGVESVDARMIGPVPMHWLKPAYATLYPFGTVTNEEMLAWFVRQYNEADMVAGHYIRGHDLPVVNGALIEFGMRPLSPKMSCDTKLDLLDSKYLSMSQENLAKVLCIKSAKKHMANQDWRIANRLTPEGTAEARDRAMDDVIQNLEMRHELLRRGLLKAPQVWKP
jgi:hypothetical protein